MIVIGIDPGLDGALVFVNSKGIARGMTLIPTIGEGRGRRVNLKLFTEKLSKLPTTGVYAFLEVPNAMPGQSSIATAKQFRIIGQIEGVLAGLNIPYMIVNPLTWTAWCHSKKSGEKSKEKTRLAFNANFNELKVHLEKMPDWKAQAIMDASMIARWGLHRFKASGFVDALSSQELSKQKPR